MSFKTTTTISNAPLNAEEIFKIREALDKLTAVTETVNTPGLCPLGYAHDIISAAFELRRIVENCYNAANGRAFDSQKPRWSRGVHPTGKKSVDDIVEAMKDFPLEDLI